MDDTNLVPDTSETNHQREERLVPVSINEKVWKTNPTEFRHLIIHTILEDLWSSPYGHDMIDLVLATATSLPLCKEEHAPLVWLLIVGNPSSGKTQALFALKAATESVYYLDTLTDNSFASGYINKKGKRAESLLPKLDGKCLLIKDLTTLFSMREDKVKKILGDLLAIYDGEYAKATGTVGTIAYKSAFSLVGCVTPQAIKQHHNYMSLIGGRFLMFRLSPLSDEDREAGFERAWDEGENAERLQWFKRWMVEHVEDVLTSPVPLEPETDEQQAALNRLAELLARGRGVVITEKVSDLHEETGNPRYSYQIADVQIEEPFRALKQLRTLGRALARVRGRSKITDDELELLRRVVLSSIPPERAQVLALFSKQGGTLTRKECASGTRKSLGRAVQLLNELIALRLVTCTTEKGGELLYRPVEDLSSLICHVSPW